MGCSETLRGVLRGSVGVLGGYCGGIMGVLCAVQKDTEGILLSAESGRQGGSIEVLKG